MTKIEIFFLKSQKHAEKARKSRLFQFERMNGLQMVIYC